MSVKNISKYLILTLALVFLPQVVSAATLLPVTEGRPAFDLSNDHFLYVSPYLTQNSPVRVVSSWARSLQDPNTYFMGPARGVRQSDGSYRPWAAGTAAASVDTVASLRSILYSKDGDGTYRFFLCQTTESSASCQGAGVNGESSTFAQLMAANIYWFDVVVTGGGTGIEIPSYSTTRISSLNSPDLSSLGNSVVTASTSVQFSADYISAYPVATRVCFEIDNLTTYQNLNPLCQNVNQSGILTFATSTTLVDGNQYRWRFTIWGENDTIIERSSDYFFTVVTPPYTPIDPGDSGWPFGGTPSGTSSTSTLSDLTLECDPSDTFFARSVCNLAVLLFVPSQASLAQLDQNLAGLMEKQPFSALNEFRVAWLSVTQNPDVSYSTLTLEFYEQDVEVISTSTLALVAGNNALNTIRYLMAIGLWIAFAWFCFIRVSKFF